MLYLKSSRFWDEFGADRRFSRSKSDLSPKGSITAFIIGGLIAVSTHFRVVDAPKSRCWVPYTSLSSCQTMTMQVDSKRGPRVLRVTAAGVSCMQTELRSVHFEFDANFGSPAVPELFPGAWPAKNREATRSGFRDLVELDRRS